MLINPVVLGIIITLAGEGLGLIVYGVARSLMEVSGMEYQTRIENYESEKKELQKQGLTPQEYQAAVAALAKKWRV